MLSRQIRNTCVMVLALSIPSTVLAWKMESGQVSLPATSSSSTTWVTVDFQQSYDTTPLVFALPDEGSGYPADRPASLRIRNVTTDDFEIVQVEPSANPGDVDGSHPAMSVQYLAIEPGDHTLPDGTRLLADSKNITESQSNVPGDSTWSTGISFPTFGTEPGVLTMIQTVNNGNFNAIPGAPANPWVTTAMQALSATGFDIALERAEVGNPLPTNAETVGYLAFDVSVQGTFFDNSCMNVAYETIASNRQVRGWDNACTAVNFSNTYGSTPNVFASMNERRGGNGGWPRRCSFSNSAVGLAIDEDQYADSERNHTQEDIGIFVASSDFVYDSSVEQVCGAPLVEYRMDECFWSGLVSDIKDSSASALNSTSQSSANTFDTGAHMCRSGDLVNAEKFAQVDVPLINLAADWTLSAWVELPLDPAGHVFFSGTTVHMFGSVSGEGDLAYLMLDGGNLNWGVYDNSGNLTENDITDPADGWHQFVVTQTGSVTSLHIDGVLVDQINLGTTGTVEFLFESSDGSAGSRQTIGANVDELKIWDRVLTIDEIGTLYTLETSDKNYDGSDRECPVCSASIAAGTWELIGLPADDRAILPGNPTTVGDVFSDDMTGTFNTEWAIFKRIYSPTDNSSSYEQLDDLSDPLEFGKGYWLGSSNAETWNVNGEPSVDYDSTDPACTATRCVEIDLVAVSLNFGAPDNDTDDGSGPYRYNLSGFVGNTPVDWADCRFLVDGTAYTPSAAEAAELFSKQIWQYNPGDGGANAEGYTTCDDTGIGTCKLIPNEGFWVEGQGPTKGKTVKLLIPQE